MILCFSMFFYGFWYILMFLAKIQENKPSGFPICSPIDPDWTHEAKLNLRAYAHKLDFVFRMIKYVLSNLVIWQSHVTEPYGKALWQSQGLMAKQ